jgi:hypothetical protein
MSFSNRIGTFIFLLGVVLVFLFIFSDIAGKPAFAYFFFGVLCLVGGVGLWWRSPSPPPSEPPARFRTVKKMMKKGDKKKNL